MKQGHLFGKEQGTGIAKNFSFQMQQRKFPRPYLRNDTMDFHF